MQYVHGIFHNLAYWIQAHKLSVIQRFPLYDLGFELLAELSEANSHWSEYLVFGAIFAPAIGLVASIAVFKQNPEKPRYIAIILKRVLFHISIALTFRIISFLVTALPGPARQCSLNFDKACLNANPGNPVSCVIPNPLFKPPTTTVLFTNLDALRGCGDLMFSSHTIYTLSFILTVSKYWWNKYLVTLMVSVQIAIAFLIVASRKHYTLDVFTALYVVPLLWFTHEAWYKDINHKDTVINQQSIQEFYGIDVQEETEMRLNDHDNVPVESEQVQVVIDGENSESPAAMYKRKDSMQG